MNSSIIVKIKKCKKYKKKKKPKWSVKNQIIW